MYIYIYNKKNHIEGFLTDFFFVFLQDSLILGPFYVKIV